MFNFVSLLKSLHQSKLPFFNYLMTLFQLQNFFSRNSERTGSLLKTRQTKSIVMTEETIQSLFKIRVAFIWNMTLSLWITACWRFEGSIAQASKRRVRLPTDAVLRYPYLLRCDNLKTRKIQDSLWSVTAPPPPPATPGHLHNNAQHICSSDSSELFVWMTQNTDTKKTRLPFHQFIVSVPVTRKVPLPLPPPRHRHRARPRSLQRIDARSA